LGLDSWPESANIAALKNPNYWATLIQDSFCGKLSQADFGSLVDCITKSQVDVLRWAFEQYVTCRASEIKEKADFLEKCEISHDRHKGGRSIPIQS